MSENEDVSLRPRLLLWRLVCLGFAALFAPQAKAISEQMQQFLTWEADHNIRHADYVRYTRKNFTMPYVEVEMDPQKLYVVDDFTQWLNGAERGPNGMALDFAPYLPADIKNFFSYEKDGKQYIRWVFNPLDTAMYKGVLRYLDERGLNYKFYKKAATAPGDLVSELRGFRTSSKSFIMALPGTERTFSFKTGTSTSGQGEGFNRPNPSRWAHFNRKLSDYYYSQREQTKTLKVAWEAGALILPPHTIDTDNSINIRLMEEVSEGSKYHLTGFVLKDKAELRKIARRAGVTPAEFVAQASRSFGKFLVESNLVLGFRPMSAHLQNVRFELDQDGKLTGKVIMLDLTDGGPVRGILEKNGQQQLLDQWRNLVADTWVSEESYKPNSIIEDGRWIQSDIRDSAPETAWLSAMDKKALRAGAEERLHELGVRDKVRITKEGDLHFNFDSREDLITRLKAGEAHNCPEAFAATLGVGRAVTP
jgi:hypothetical protein